MVHTDRDHNRSRATSSGAPHSICKKKKNLLSVCVRSFKKRLKMRRSCDDSPPVNKDDEEASKPTTHRTSSNLSDSTASSESDSQHCKRRSSHHRHNSRRSSKSSNRAPAPRRLSANQDEVVACLPAPFRQFVLPYHGDFCFSRVFNPSIIAQLMAEGFLPIATATTSAYSYLLLPKLHSQRCVIGLRKQQQPAAAEAASAAIDTANSDTTCDLHVSKSVRKKAKKFTITANTCFDAVIQGCQEQHGDRCWLYPPLVEAFRHMFQAKTMNAVAIDEETKQPDRSRPPWPVRLYTIEIWNAQTGALAGGELGYTVGSIYTSLTGFSKEDSAGSVQMAALGRWLMEHNFEVWDLGMDMDYKRALGAKLMPRREFVGIVHRVRESQGHLVLPVRAEPENTKDILDRTQPAANASMDPSSSSQEKTKLKNKKAKKKQQQNRNPKGQADGQGSDAADVAVQQKLERASLSHEHPDQPQTAAAMPKEDPKQQRGDAVRTPTEQRMPVHQHDDTLLEGDSPTKKRVRKLSPSEEVNPSEEIVI